MVEAPDILYNETSNDTIVAEGASVALRCEARGYPEPTVTWRREDGAPIVLRNHQTPNRRKMMLNNIEIYQQCGRTLPLGSNYVENLHFTVPPL